MYSTEKFIADNTDKLPEEGQAPRSQTAIDDLKKALAGTDLDEVKAKHEALAKASQALGTAMYAAAAQEAGDGAPVRSRGFRFRTGSGSTGSVGLLELGRRRRGRRDRRRGRQ